MSQHYPKSTVEASAWCKKCRKDTMHRVDGVNLGPCLVCLKKLMPKPKWEPLQGIQLDLFGK